MDITQEELHRLFEYREGQLFWKVDRTHKTKVGKKVGRLDSHGHATMGIYYKQYPLQQIIYYMFYGIFCKYVKFIDGDHSNLKIENLCAVNTLSQTRLNPKPNKSNISGFKGVYWDSQRGKWKVKFIKEKKIVHVGFFDDPKEAYESYCKAIKEHFDINLNNKQ